MIPGRVDSIDITIGGTTAPPLLRTGVPVTWGLPLPRGLATSTSTWALGADDGTGLPLQAAVLSRWPDGSVRWALLDTQVSTGLQGTWHGHLHLNRGAGSAGAALAQPLANGLEIHTGVARFHLSTGAPLGIADVSVDGRPAIATDGCSLRLSIDQGECRIRWHRVEIEENGPLRASVRLEGEARVGRRTVFALTARAHFFHGLSAVRLRLTIRNPRRAVHRGGCWDLGDAGSQLIRELSVVVRRSAGWTADRLGCTVEPGRPVEEAVRQVAVYQDSSGGERWQSSNHINRNGVVPNRFRGYRFTTDARVQEGRRATPVVLMEGPGGGLAATCPDFWENFPRALAADREGIAVGLFPSQYADLHELQGGEQKTHEVWLAFGPDRVTEIPLDWCRSPLVAAASPEWYAATGAVPYLTPEADDPHVQRRALVRSAIEGPESFPRKRERIDEFGWRHFGDIYGDHEAVRHAGPAPLVSHYNNQYDAVGGFALQFMRSGDPRWWTQCLELAAHVIDIDIYHTDEDKSAYNHGLFWHTVHYTDAADATHRTYPRTPGAGSGGPSSEHNYTTGLLLHHFMTGDPASAEAVIELATWVIEMDDGRKTVFRWLTRDETGLSTGSLEYQGPGRGPGNSLSALVDAHVLTNERRFLDKAEQIIRRCSHPDQPIEALNLLDRENRWFYTVFLESLGKYLDHKSALNELDEMYAYGRSVLLHYARWMANHEYPYLSRPEELEFPTETWAAQDIRKSDVFGYALRHTAGEERPRFAERAAFYFKESVETLNRMPTRTLTRPIVLLLGHGFVWPYLQRNPDGVAPQPVPALETHVERFQPFVPQKAIALRRAKALAVAAALSALTLLVLVAGIMW